jgi:Cu-Zn family superoxide dismutase
VRLIAEEDTMRGTLLSLLSVVAAGCWAGNESHDAMLAGAILEPRSGFEDVVGLAAFVAKPDGKVVLRLKVLGAPPGLHGAHIHAVGDCSAPDASSAGPHWNPDGAMHGSPDAASHLGDLGNLEVDAHGVGVLTISRPGWTLDDGSAHDVVDKAIVIHEKADDLASQPAGNSGARIACGVIK